MHYFVCMSMIKEPRFGKLLLLPESVLSVTLPPCFDPRLCNARTCYLLTVHASEPIPPLARPPAAPSAKTRFPRVGSASRPTNRRASVPPPPPPDPIVPLNVRRSSSCLCSHSARLDIPRSVLEWVFFFHEGYE